MSLYPSNLLRYWTSKQGTPITIRPIRPEDREIEKEFVHQLSPRSKYLRFFSGLNELTPTMLSRFTCIEYEREMALIAVLKKEDREVEIAVGRYVEGIFHIDSFSMIGTGDSRDKTPAPFSRQD